MDKPYEEIGNCTITVISGLKTEGGERNEISKWKEDGSVQSDVCQAGIAAKQLIRGILRSSQWI